MDITIILSLILCLIVGVAVGALIRHLLVVAENKEKQRKAEDVVNKAKEDANEIRYRARKEAKDIAQEEREKAEREIKIKQQDLQLVEKELKKKDELLERKFSEHESEINRVREKERELERDKGRVQAEIEAFKKKQEDIVIRLTEVSGLSKEAAKQELLDRMTEEARVDFAKIIKKMDEDAKDQAEKNAKKIISTAIQRFAGEYVSEKTIGSVELPSDDVKGRLIGREGRNIRAFEHICGVDLIIDDTPETVVISTFNVVRREIARKTIEKMIADGRIHPAKIEEFYEKSKAEMEREMRELGEKAQMELGLHGIHPEVLKLVGALNWRTSYTQNQYQHAIETAFLCGIMASELGQNVKQARRAGLLHDIGKVLDASAEGSHAVVGANFLKKYGESPDIIHAVRAHHEDEKPESVLAHLVTAADALSGARPGARKAMMESYVSRLTDIEEIVNSFSGVSNCYAISGGREVRVFVSNDKVSDDQTFLLSQDIAKKIESEMSYPGTIKITVIRETKAIGIAK